MNKFKMKLNQHKNTRIVYNSYKLSEKCFRKKNHVIYLSKQEL